MPIRRPDRPKSGVGFEPRRTRAVTSPPLPTHPVRPETLTRRWRWLFFEVPYTTSLFAADLAATTTDSLAQVSTNKYWSNILFDTRQSATTSLPNIITLANLSLAATQLTNFGNPFFQYFSATTTTALAEGSNLYYTPNRVAGVIAGTTTTALAEGTNKYYTDARVQAYLAGVDKGFFFSTTSADAFAAQRNFFSTTSADAFIAQRNLFSTTSSDVFVSQRSFFSTTSTNYWKSVTDLFSTTSSTCSAHTTKGSSFRPPQQMRLLHRGISFQRPPPMPSRLSAASFQRARPTIGRPPRISSPPHQLTSGRRRTISSRQPLHFWPRSSTG